MMHVTPPADDPARTAVTLWGIKVKLQGADACRRCGYPVAIIKPPTGKHCADLKCGACNAICGALSERTASFVRSVGNKFGAPTTPILLRRGPAA
jgi:hypothetical protein